MKTFGQHLSEQPDQSKLDRIIYSKPLDSKRVKQLTRPYPVFQHLDLEDWMGFPPPSNSSQETTKELHYIISLGEFRTQWEDDMIMSDTKIMKAFQNYLDEYGLEVNTLDRIKEYKEQSEPVILALKQHYKRPRPIELAKEMGLALETFPLKTANTPSYPSGHATQGRLVARLLADEVPLEHRKNILDIGKRIAEGRQIAGAHYPSDTEFGYKLGDRLYDMATSGMEPDLKLESTLKENIKTEISLDMWLPPGNENSARTVIFEGAALWGLVGKKNALSNPEWAGMSLGKNSLGVTTIKDWYENYYLKKKLKTPQGLYVKGPEDLWEDFCKKLGGHMVQLDGVTSSSKFIWKSIKDYYDNAPKSWQVPHAGKPNTADCVIISSGNKSTLISKAKELKKLSEEEQVKRTVSDGSKITIDGDVSFYQVSLKKDAAPGEARAGKWTQLAGKDLERSNKPAGVAKMAAGQEPLEVELTKDYYEPSFTYNRSEYLEEGLFGGLVDKIKNVASGFLKKVKKVFKKIVRFIISKAKKLTDKIIKSDKKVKAAKGLATEMEKMGMPLKEEMLNEETFNEALWSFKKDRGKNKPVVYNETMYNHIQAFKKDMASIKKSFNLIETNVNALNAAQKRTRIADPIIYTKGKEAEQINVDLNKLQPLFKVKPGTPLDGNLYSMFWTVLNVTSNWVSYIYINNVLSQINDKMNSYENLENGLSDAVLSMSGDVSAEAKFGNTALPIVIVKGGNSIDHLGKRDNYSAAQAGKLKKKSVYKANWPIMQIKITRIGKEGALHNAVTLFLLENVEIGSDEKVTPIYSNTSFSSKSGKNFTTAAEVGTPRKGYKKI
tara:strand:+ start:9734 stop:12244 length:2511 start_codon:yes stop_codon:yes gene_type:complete